MRWFQPAPSAKIALWILPLVMVIFLYNNYRGESFLDLFNILQRLASSTTGENLECIFPEERFPRDIIPRRDGGQIRVIYQSPEQEIWIRDENGPLPSELESCNEVPYLYAVLIVSISSSGRVDGYSWDGEGPCWGTCCGRE